MTIANALPTIKFVGEGFNASAVFNRLNTTNQLVGGVKIDFQNRFSDFPSVIATPMIGTEDGFFWNETDSTLKLPNVVVDHISEKSTFIKSDIVSNIDNLISRPISFHFVAVGPISKEVAFPRPIYLTG